MIQVPLLYGRSQLMLSVPDEIDVTVIRKPLMPVLPNPAAALCNALEHCIPAEHTEEPSQHTEEPGQTAQSSSPRSLQSLAAGARSACVAICDITRPVPNHLFLRPVIETLVDAGLSLNRITVLVATGLHRPNLGSELLELIGDRWVLDHVRVVNHDALCDADHADLGATATRGTPVKIDRRFVESDLRIATGLVEPHFMAGFSGGRKVIAPGLAHADTIRTFHNHAFMADPAATNCNLHRNPLHEEQLEIVRMIGGALAINTVIDENRNLSMINCGEIIASHAAAVAFIQPFCRVAVPRRFPIVVTSGAGYPLDKTYYQTIKGMVGALEILQPGGDLVIASECSEGLGSDDYAAAQRVLTKTGPAGFLDLIRRKPLADIDAWQTQMQTKAMAIGQIHLSTALASRFHAHTGVRVVEDLNHTVRELIKARGCRSLAVIPEGPYVIPYLRSM